MGLPEIEVIKHRYNVINVTPVGLGRKQRIPAGRIRKCSTYRHRDNSIRQPQFPDQRLPGTKIGKRAGDQNDGLPVPYVEIGDLCTVNGYRCVFAHPVVKGNFSGQVHCILRGISSKTTFIRPEADVQSSPTRSAGLYA